MKTKFRTSVASAVVSCLFAGQALAEQILGDRAGFVGLREREARERGIAVTTFVQELRDVDRAVVDGEVSGFVKVHVRQGGDQIVGATIVARHAGEMLSELTLAIACGVGLGAIAKVIHPYPTQAEAIKKVADAFNRTRLTPRVKRLFSTWFSLNW